MWLLYVQMYFVTVNLSGYTMYVNYCIMFMTVILPFEFTVYRLSKTLI